MSEEQQQVSTEQPASTEAPESSSLEQVYSEFNVEAEAQQFQPQVQQAPTQAQPAMPMIPDPVLDPNGFKSWQAAQTTEMQKKLAGLENFQRQLLVQEINRREVEEVKSLVADANKVVGLPAEDADLIEFAYAKQVRSDPKFARIYAERAKNPAAWRAASKALNESLAKKYAVRADPQLAENQRAIKQAQQSMATTKPQEGNSLEERLANKSGAAFDREWNAIVRGGNF